eukprot:gnl/TRDRNA2_/TRDRNA2_190511_c0_seq1.p1 gnl/TRDRNA2_/TRDRNA2_190511_c0~~gnl/TRDRNA2_/TRDRNA2_190511_c0_seq1.p1  ORF type:complete len:406 (+),score=75.08 gnl/TRDRNA2_/TRDRNA2_190511_c0_seq1:83-1300(+)
MFSAAAAIALLAGIILAHAKDSIMDQLSSQSAHVAPMKSLASDLFDRALKASALQGADVETTTLGKSGNLAITPGAVLRPLSPLRATPRSTTGSWNQMSGKPKEPRPVRVAASTLAAPVEDTAAIKSQMLQIAALTDRGQRLNKLIAPAYQEKREEMERLVERLVSQGKKPSEAQLAGDWELVYSDVELFRSSPFFLAIEEALNNSPGIPKLGRWLGATDPKKKAELFFKLHQLQVMSWGVSTVGRIGQTLNFQAGTLESSFDTTLFGLTVIPILGWFKLLPTFGGRVVTEANGLKLGENGTLCMELERTRVITAPGVPRVPLFDGLLMDRWYPVNSVWKLLPWNNGRAPTCSVKVEYVDEQMRISRDSAGAVFVYMRPTSSDAAPAPATVPAPATAPAPAPAAA